MHFVVNILYFWYVINLFWVFNSSTEWGPKLLLMQSFLIYLSLFAVATVVTAYSVLWGPIIPSFLLFLFLGSFLSHAFCVPLWLELLIFLQGVAFVAAMIHPAFTVVALLLSLSLFTQFVSLFTSSLFLFVWYFHLLEKILACGNNLPNFFLLLLNDCDQGCIMVCYLLDVFLLFFSFLFYLCLHGIEVKIPLSCHYFVDAFLSMSFGLIVSFSCHVSFFMAVLPFLLLLLVSFQSVIVFWGTSWIHTPDLWHGWQHHHPILSLSICPTILHLFNLFEICQKDLWLFPWDEYLYFELDLISVCDFANFCLEMYYHFIGSSSVISYVLLFWGPQGMVHPLLVGCVSWDTFCIWSLLLYVFSHFCFC